MIILVNGDRATEFRYAVEQMYRLRARVFQDRLGWAVRVVEGRERDVFDDAIPDYLLQQCPESGEITGCVRMLPTLGPNMLRDVFPELIGESTLPKDRLIFEASRYCVDHERAVGRSGGLKSLTYELFAGMVEYGFYKGLKDIVAVTDVRMEKILARAGWPLRRLAPPARVGVTTAVAGYLPVNEEVLNAIRCRGDIQNGVLWIPAVREAA